MAFYFVLGPQDFLPHFYTGLMATVSTLITHCWVFFYFIGTGEGIREGIRENNLDKSAIKATKKFKAGTFPFALFAMIFMMAATIFGTGVQVGKFAALWHTGFIYFALLFNLFTFYQEFKMIQRNRCLMRELNELAKRGSKD